MEFRIKNCSVIITPLFCAFLCALLLVDKTGLMLFGLLSAMIHEFGHIFFIKFSKKRINKIVFHLGGIIIDCKGIVSYKNEFLISLGGCLFNLIALVISLSFYSINHNQVILLFGATNFALLIFNLIPIEGLDGLDLIRYLLLTTFCVEKAKLYCKIISLISITILFLITIILFVNQQNISLFVCLLYLIILMLIFKK